MAIYLVRTHLRTPPLDARLRGHDGGGRKEGHSRESGNPGFCADRGFGRASSVSIRANLGTARAAGVEPLTAMRRME